MFDSLSAEWISRKPTLTTANRGTPLGTHRDAPRDRQERDRTQFGHEVAAGNVAVIEAG